VPTNIGEFVQHELKQYVPLLGRDIVSDYCGVGVGAGPHKRLLAVAADAAQVAETVRSCGPTRAAIEAVEPSVLAYARAFLTSEKEPRYGRNALIAMLAARDLTMCVFRKGMLEFVRVRDLPAETDTLAPLCAWLAEELRAVMRYYETSTPHDDCEWQARVVVQRGRYGAGEVAPLLTAEAGMPSFVVADPFDHLPAHFGGAGEDASVTAVGAALKVLDGGADDFRINLLPQEVTQARSASKRLLIGANAAAVLLVVVFLTTQVLTRATGTMQRRFETTRLSKQLYAAPALIAQERYLHQEISRVEQQVRRLQGVLTRREVDWPAVLDGIGRAVPARVRITHIACGDNQNLSLKGSAPSYDTAQGFVCALDGHEPFESVSLTRIQRQPNHESLMQYQIDCSLKPAH
jgi:Tfp pilus assembly protein PilN